VEVVKKAHPDVAVGAVGMTTTPQQANDILAEGKADIVLLAREFLHDPHFVLRAASELGVAVKPALRYKRAWRSAGAHLEIPMHFSSRMMMISHCSSTSGWVFVTILNDPVD